MKYQVQIIFTGKFYQIFKLKVFNLILSIPESGKIRIFSQSFYEVSKSLVVQEGKIKAYLIHAHR